MKTLFGLMLASGLSLVPLYGQPGGGGGMGGPPGLGLSGSTAKLFGDNSTFSADLELQIVEGKDSAPMTMPGKIFFDQGKSRFEIDMSQMRGGKMPPQAAEQMKSIGMDKMIMISRPDKKLGFQVYPGMQAYVENPSPELEMTGESNDYKLEMTELGKETVDGHPCVKNKAVVTDKQGTKHESFIWNAIDLKKFPIRIEQTESGAKTTMLFKDLKFSKPAAEMFEPPANATKYNSMQSMMQQVMMKKFGGGLPAPGQ